MRTYDDKMFIDTFEHEYTWLNGFLRNVSRFSTRNALLDPETHRAWNYKSLNCEANRLSNALQSAGIKKNDVVMSALRNSPEFAFSYIGVRKVGGILLSANFNLAAGEFSLLIQHNKPKIVIYSANIAHIIEETQILCEKNGFVPQKFILADNLEKVAVPKNHISYEEYP